MSDMSRGIFDAVVASNTALCREHYRLTFRIRGFPASEPGQFVQLECRDPSINAIDREFIWTDGTPPPAIEGVEFRGHDAFLRRPFSIAGRREVGNGETEIDLIGREVGSGTRFLGRLKAGDTISIAGPLGNVFQLPPEGGLALLVGGGVGIPPMIYLAQRLSELGGRRGVAFAGALTKDLLALTARTADADGLFDVDEFRPFGVPVALTTDDGTLGVRGFVTDALVRYLDANAVDPAKTVIYTCGPEPMMKRVQAIAAERAIPAQIAVERAMACGMGTCQSCCIKVRKSDPAAPPLAGKDWCWRLACTDGPVFDGAALLW